MENMVVPRFVAVDFETYYDSKIGYSLRNMSPHAYVNDPRFDAYMVAIVDENGDEYVGPPEGYDWNSLAGATLVMHNAAFDGMVINRLIELGKIPEFQRELFDTADMVAFMCLPRSLKSACKYLLGMDISKAQRTAMDGKKYQDIPEEQRKALLEYAADDSRLALQLCKTYKDRWPEWEQIVSKVNREGCWRGIHVNRKAVEDGLVILRTKSEEAAKALPWSETCKTGSRAAFLLHVKSIGLPVPKTVNKTDPEMIAWIEKYKDAHPFIKARMDYASLQPHIARLEAMLTRADQEDVLRFESLYYAAHTGRCSGKGREDAEGGGRVNVYNIPKGDKHGLTHGVDMRGLMVPRPGRVFMIYDFAQIEARVVQWISGNTPFLRLVEKENIYQATAKMLGWYPTSGTNLKGEDSKGYALAKESCLGSGFGMGAAKFLLTCRRKGVVLPVVPKDQWVLDRRAKFILRNLARLDWNKPEDEAAISAFFGADAIVRQWRTANKPVPELWGKLEQALKDAAEKHVPCHEFVLPSGRVKPYWNPHLSVRTKLVYDPDTGEPETKVENRLCASLIRGDLPDILHGGVITENIVQATARDIMFFGMLAVRREAPMWSYVMNCYDELIWEIDKCDVEAASRVIPQCLCLDSSLSWTKGLPLGVEGGMSLKYEKGNKGWREWPGEGGWEKRLGR